MRTSLGGAAGAGLLVVFLSLGVSSATDPVKTLSGTLEVTQEDYFATGKTRRIHFIRDAESGKTYHIRFLQPPSEHALSGATAIVRGVVKGNQVTVASADGFSVVAGGGGAPAGTRNAIVMVVDFQDDTVSCTTETVAGKMFTDQSSIDGLYQESSFGSVSFPPDTDGDGSPDVIRVTIDAWTTDSCDPWGWAASANTEAENALVDLGLYQHRVYVLPTSNQCGWAGYANVGCAGTCSAFNKHCTLQDVYAHELGHNLGLRHASTDLDNDGTIDCEYCDASDFMSYGGVGWRQVNGPHKIHMDWLPPAQIVDLAPASAETHTLSPLENDPQAALYPQVLRIAIGGGDAYFASYRRRLGYDQSLSLDYTDKTSIHASAQDGSGNSRFIVALADGEEFLDSLGISITQVSHDADSVTLLVAGPGSGCGDADGDGICDNDDVCPGFDDTLDADGDGVPDGCDACPGADDNLDTDGDGTPDCSDPCPMDNPDDSDGDGICDGNDICPGFDDALDGDGDGVPDGCDACPGIDDSLDSDGDGVPDCADPCPMDNPDDSDGDGVCDSADLCPGADDTLDADADGLPDGCDGCPNDPDNNIDGDNRCGDVDNCPTVPNNNQRDDDGDGVGDACDSCPGADDTLDSDGDGVPDGCDACPADVGKTVPGQCGCGIPDADSDADGVADCLDICPGFNDLQDGDGDSVPDGCDACPAGDDTADADGDGVADACDACPVDNPDDSDGDGVCDSADACPGGDDTADADSDTVPDSCDTCPQDPGNDADGDTVCGDADAYPADGTRSGPIVVGEISAVDDFWQTVQLTAVYQDPVILVGPASKTDPEPGVVRIQNVTATSFDIRFQEWRYLDGVHGEEQVSYLVIERGREVMSDGSVWEAGLVDLSGTGSFIATSFTQGFGATPSLFLSAQTASGYQPVVVRARSLDPTGFEAALFEEQARMDGHSVERVGYLAIHSAAGHGTIAVGGADRPYRLQQPLVDERPVPVLGWNVAIEEEQSEDAELYHSDETICVLALGGSLFAQDVSTAGWDTANLRRQDPEPSVAMEWGVVDGVTHSWSTVPLLRSYVNPVVIAKPASRRGGQPGVVRVRNTTADSFEIKFQEWKYLDGAHSGEQVFYIVAEAGQHALAGLTVEAGIVSAGTGWTPVGFTAGFAEAPTLFAGVASYVGSDPVVTRLRDRSTTGFDVRLFEEEGGDRSHTAETIGWIAISPGSGMTAGGKTLEVRTDWVGSVPGVIDYSQVYYRRHPTVVADVSSTHGWETCGIRLQNVTSSYVVLYVEEEQSRDVETSHALEEVSLFVAE